MRSKRRSSVRGSSPAFSPESSPWMVKVFPELVGPYAKRSPEWPSNSSPTSGRAVSSKRLFCWVSGPKTRVKRYLSCSATSAFFAARSRSRPRCTDPVSFSGAWNAMVVLSTTVMVPPSSFSAESGRTRRNTLMLSTGAAQGMCAFRGASLAASSISMSSEAQLSRTSEDITSDDMTEDMADDMPPSCSCWISGSGLVIGAEAGLYGVNANLLMGISAGGANASSLPSMAASKVMMDGRIAYDISGRSSIPHPLPVTPT
mmetsp:Transcript_37563/g.88861  ORF Transcript_37563/g.88861 Transcript_37563/m.88861 type:complete len:259 (+) Transcript_37563:4017-4793(+)